MDKILNYQISFFGEFANLKASEDNIQKFLNVLNDFIFMPVPMTSIDIRTNRLIVDNRMQFISSSKQYYITVLPERIDFTYNLTNNDSEKKEFLEVQKELLSYVTKLSSVLSDKQGNRLANSSVFALRSFSSEQELNTYINHFSNKELFFEKNDSIVEWQVRYNSRRDITFNEKVEKSNCIINLSIPNNPQMKNTVLMTVDINTDPRNNTLRFQINDLNAYVNKATTMFGEFEEKANNE